MSSRRRRTALTAGILLTPALAACGAGPEATATLDYAPADGVQASAGDLRVLNALVVAPPEGQSTAVVSLSIASRDEADELVDVTVSNAEARIEGSTEVPVAGVLRYGAPGSPDQLFLDDFAGPDGGNVELTLLFETAGEVTLNPPILAPNGYYEDLTADGLEAPDATAVPSPTVAPSVGVTEEAPATGIDESEPTPTPAAT